MKLKSLSITNFRQFWKEVILDFSQDEEKNVTVIHGANGAGKTSLLNAFKWCFYGTTDFDTKNDNILNESSIFKAKIGQEIEIKIVVLFENDGKDYEACRTEKYIKVDDNLAERLDISQFKISIIDDDAQYYEQPAPKSVINEVLPEGLQPYFFFNGERIEKLAGVNESEQIKEAIKRLMGLKQVERAQRHLEKVSRKFKREIGKQLGPDSEALAKSIDVLSDDIAEKKSLLEKHKSKLKKTENLISEVDNQLNEFKAIKDLQDERSRLNARNKDDLEVKMERNIEERTGNIDKNRSILLSSTIVEKCGTVVDENRKKGILPYKIRAPFIDDLISNNTCICGSTLDDRSISHLEEVKKNAGDDELDSAYNAVSYFLKGYSKSYNDYIERSTQLISEYDELKAEYKKNNDRISEISAELQKSSDANVAELENERENYDKSRSDINLDIRVIETELPKLYARLDTEQKTLDKLMKEEEVQEAARKRLDTTNNIHDALIDLNHFLSERVREDLSEKVEKTFSSIIRKDMRAYIDSSFTLRVEKTLAEQKFDAKEQSTGEKQVTSLSFISSIISLAKEKRASGNKFFKGGMYPLVMDSPFGALDEDYQYKVAQQISELADQVVMFVSNSQWSGNVKQASEHKVGKCYKLVHYTKSDSASDQNYSDFLRPTDDDGEYSVLEEVK
ncbi:AAA family ATPase [Vibrio breoganii]